jgi:alpha-glucosidase
VLLLTLRGTPTLYYGDEIGMRDAVILPEQVRDPQGKNIGVSRDPARTPMQWTSGPHAGFSTATPWLPIGHDYEDCNVELQRHDADSMLSLYRRLIALRRAEAAFSVGSYCPVIAPAELIAYVREAGERRFLVVLNLSPRPAHLPLDEIGAGLIVVATRHSREGRRAEHRLVMLGDDAVVLRLDP